MGRRKTAPLLEALVAQRLQVKKVLAFLVWFAVSVYLTYQLWSAFTSGVIRGRRAYIFTLQDDPILFSISVIICIAFLVLITVMGWHSVDYKVKQFGGNYNINTFKAIARHALRKSN